ncbi:aldose epimerase family protein [Actinomadura alba]|uniref:aldose epimerase family protein n=1 Tax=Actinomadura alba TaxID=406431 RepID=UPI001C9D19FB|nr:aldose epimerase family protein [Actinomadura alba]
MTEGTEGVAAGGVAERLGTTPDGTPVARYTLANGRGLRARVLTYGCVVERLEVPDREGRWGNVVLGCASLGDYLTKSRYFGAVVGRYGNRIAGGRFRLDGTEYRLARNNGGNSLHGGERGFDKRVWEVLSADERRLSLGHLSADGEEGYPGALQVSVTYTVTDDDALRIDYRATTDRPTVLNLTNHSYFNLAGEGSGEVYDHQVTINAGRYAPVDAGQIPTGELAPVEGTPFDFTRACSIGKRIRDPHPQLLIGHGYDHNYVLDKSAPGVLEPAALVEEPTSGRVMEVLTTEPGVQFYSGNVLDGGVTGPSGRAYGKGAGLCLETQHFPDSPNQPHFPSTVLRPGEEFTSTTVFRFHTN